jgi:Aspartyl/Asparaginyl beta-hydroxylase
MKSTMRLSQGLRNFRRVSFGIDVRPFLVEIAAAEQLWLQNTWRQDRIAVQRETNTIFLRGVDGRSTDGSDINDVQECFTTREAANFPALMAFLGQFAETNDASLQRAMIVRLKPIGRVYPHVDRGAYYQFRDRYHLVLVSPGGSELSSGGERMILREGEVWWLDNKRVHSARNLSADWRVHAIFDLLSLRVNCSPA